MKVSIPWLKELVDLKIPIEELIRLLPLRTIGIKEATDRFIELDMKGYNRADFLSMRGIAYEIAAITGSKATFSGSDQNNYCWSGKDLPEAGIEVENPDLCPTYCIAKIEGLKIGPSKAEWAEKLANCGMRPINNAADVTNLIMLEYGQPMHAFDERKVKESVKVRVAKKGEKILTLDGKVRNLNEEDLLIADHSGPIGIAGVMGGKDSEVSQNSTAILLEAAIFDPVGNRKTSKRHDLPSEASKRFQHGLTRTNLLRALSTAIKMYAGLGGKLTAITLAGNLKDESKVVKLTQEKINSLIGIAIPPKEVESSLKKLGFSLASQGQTLQSWEVTVPYWRMDINIEEDLIEEVARMYVYEKIPPRELEGEFPAKTDQSFPEFIYNLKKALANAGLTEVQTYSFYSSKTIYNLRLTIYDLVKIANPISSETEYLRNNLWPNLVEVTAKNLKIGIKDIAIFEIGKTYSPQEGGLPKEGYCLGVALCNGTSNPIQELNEIFKKALKHLKREYTQRGEKMQLHLGGGNAGEHEKKYFHPTRFSSIKPNGFIAEIHPRFINKFGVEQRIAVLEIPLKP